MYKIVSDVTAYPEGFYSDVECYIDSCKAIFKPSDTAVGKLK